MTVELLEEYRISPTGDRAFPLRGIVDYFSQIAPGISTKNAVKELPKEQSDLVFEQLANEANVKDEMIEIGNHRRVDLKLAPVEEVDFTKRFIYLVKSNNETELHALLRHLRNAIAHGNFFVKFAKRDTFICFLDFDKKGASARVVVNKASMKRWMKTLKACDA